MFMFKSPVELIKENQRLERREVSLEGQISRLEDKLDKAGEKAGWEVEQIKNTVRKDMQKKLIESDLKRTEAVAKLNTYIDMDTKDERKHIQEMLEKAIEGLGNRTEVKIVKE